METVGDKSRMDLIKERLLGIQGSELVDIRPVVPDCHLFPCIFDILLAHGREKGAKGGRIGIYLRNHKLQVVVSWPDVQGYGFVPVSTFTGLLEDVEGAIRDDRIDWLKDGQENGKKKF